MDRSHLIKASLNPTENEPRNVEIRELEKPLIEIKDGVAELILCLQVIERKPGGEVPFCDREVLVKADGQKVADIMTDESGLIEAKRVIVEKGKATITITVSGTTALYRKKISEITTTDFDTQKRMDEDTRKKSEIEKKRRDEEVRQAVETARELERTIAEQEKIRIENEPKNLFQQKVGELYSRWPEFAVQRYMMVDRRENLRIEALDLKSRVDSGISREKSTRAIIKHFEELIREENRIIIELNKNPNGKQAGGKIVAVREEITETVKKIIVLHESLGLSFAEGDYVRNLREFLSEMRKFLRGHDDVAGMVLYQIEACSVMPQDEFWVNDRLEEAIRILSSFIYQHTYSLVEFLPEFNYNKFPQKSCGIWRRIDVVAGIKYNAKCQYTRLDTIEKWHRFKEDISSYLGQPLEETEFYRNNQADFELIERCKDSRKIGDIGKKWLVD
jgi:hypothetical protein